jgi:hypothetical protein
MWKGELVDFGGLEMQLFVEDEPKRNITRSNFLKLLENPAKHVMMMSTMRKLPLVVGNDRQHIQRYRTDMTYRYYAFDDDAERGPEAPVL